MAGTRFAIRFSPGMRVLIGILGMGPAHSAVHVDTDTVHVRMGVGFSARIDRASIRSADHDDKPVTGWGVHGWRGKWLVNGSSRGLVRIAIDPAARARMLGLPITVRLLRISLVDPDGLLAELGAPRV